MKKQIILLILLFVCFMSVTTAISQVSVAIEETTVTISSSTDSPFHLDDDEHKLFGAIASIFFTVLFIALFINGHDVALFIRRKRLVTTIFYQSNYVIKTP
ncbi:hypothetical protein [Fredinandcohnia sp. 179-A 10B2 NHS]|uniref:hypothetical protein n=1 Tax=Fredinandcohnia sp. 179-A 10B2 NHS TaxID=3235176 RepID=UPI0039A01DD5